MLSATGNALSAERPFPGLRPFGPQDRAFFFGRSAQYFALYRLLNLSRFLAVVGNSGSGKSSLVRAGLLPLLAEESMESSGRRWEWVEMRPGDAPLDSLAATLSRLARAISPDDDPGMAATRDARIERQLRGSSHGVAKAVSEMQGAAARTVVLLVDQFEELFRFAVPASGTPPQEAARLREEAAHFVHLLLEASRSATANIHVVITLRSDFIGDCARFQGLPEAVSGTQFLVPSLTRDQREEVIRKPFEAAGSKIEPALVEQLLNDSGDEMDQLPVLQHCLLRLWERAGQRRGPTEGEGGAAARHVLESDYQAIGGMSRALSVHADEILGSDLKGKDELVGRVFMALSDLDRDGRATRRALPFDRLARETAIGEQELAVIVNRFRADDCSFLTPSVASALALSPSARVDVGHEALLRRWERVSGVPGATGERGDRRAIGWLAEEHADGQRYHALLAMAGSDDGPVARLSSEQAARYWTWWNERPRTSEWAERYGGGHHRVLRLLKTSRAARNRSRIFVGALTALTVFVTGGGLLAYAQYRQAQTRADVAAQTSELAVETIRGAIDAVRDAQNHSRISVSAERDLLAAIAEPTLSITGEAPELMSLAANMQIAFADALTGAGATSEALKRAENAAALADRLVAIDSSRKEWRRLVFSSAFRIGDAMLSTRPSEQQKDEAIAQYQKAQAYAQGLAAEQPERADRQFDLAFAHNKIGEGRQIQNRYPASLDEFRIALGIARLAASLDESDPGYQAYVAATYVKIGNSLQWQRPSNLDGALENYSTAVEILDALHEKVPNNAVVASNLASARRGRGDILIRRWEAGGFFPEEDFHAAVEAYTEAVAMVAALRATDPTNTSWLVFLGPCYSRLGSAYEKAGDFAAALTEYRNEVSVRAQLSQTDPTNERWLDNLRAAEERVAKVLALIAAGAPPSNDVPPVEEQEEDAPPPRP
ncbi:MAG: hypothetical protein AB7I79_03550 [Rhizobiaceae bacterium]